MMVTLGQYGFLWGFSLARDVNQMAGGKRIAVRRHSQVFGIGYVIYILSAIAISVYEWRADVGPAFDTLFSGVFLLGVALFSYFVWLLICVGRELRGISHCSVPRSSSIIILSFLWMTSLPLLQSHLNKMPNQAPLPTPVSVTPAAGAPVAPATGAAEL